MFPASSVSLVKTQYLTFAEDEPFWLESGAALRPVTLAYEVYGRLNTDRSNAILICHALSGGAHAAGYLSPDDAQPGWWDDCIGPGKAFDTDRFCVICSNVLGSCCGSSGPSSVDPAWNNGDYYLNGRRPDAGLSVARMVGHITYLSEQSMHEKFGRRLQGRERYGYKFQTEFEIESYLKHNGDKFTRRFDANS